MTVTGCRQDEQCDVRARRETRGDLMRRTGDIPVANREENRRNDPIALGRGAARNHGKQAGGDE